MTVLTVDHRVSAMCKCDYHWGRMTRRGQAWARDVTTHPQGFHILSPTDGVVLRPPAADNPGRLAGRPVVFVCFGGRTWTHGFANSVGLLGEVPG